VAALGIAALIGLAAGGFSWSHIGGAGTALDERKTVSLDGADSVVIEGISDDVIVTDAAGTELDAWLHGNAGGRPEADLPRLSAERTGSTVTVKVERQRNVVFGFIWSNIRLDIGMPKGYAGSVSITTSSGSIDVADHRYAEVALNATSGDLRVGTVTAASFTAHTSSGTIRAESVSARSADISSTSGDVRLKGLAGDSRLHTTSGTVNAVYSAVPSRIDASSTSGGVTLRFPADAQFQLDAHATSGDITCKFPITVTQGSGHPVRNALVGSVGTSTNQVTIRTTSGNIRIEK
jgi:lia operon protein LiaG